MSSLRATQGQILVLVLLVVLVGLTIGLSIASRTLTNIKNAGDLDQSNRAFSAAEAGIEKALADLKAGGNCSAGCDPGITGIATDVDVTPAGNSDKAFGIPNLAKDDVIQVNLDGYTAPTFDIYWGTNTDSGESQTAAIVVSVVYVNSAGTSYGLGKATYDPLSSRNNNFTVVSPTWSYPTANGLTLQDESVRNDYAHKATVNLTNGSGQLIPASPAGNRPILARVRLLYAGPKQIAIAPVGANLPMQGDYITSTATAGGKTRTVKVFKSRAALPAIFDYALFNGSTNALTK